LKELMAAAQSATTTVPSSVAPSSSNIDDEGGVGAGAVGDKVRVSKWDTPSLPSTTTEVSTPQPSSSVTTSSEVGSSSATTTTTTTIAASPIASMGSVKSQWDEAPNRFVEREMNEDDVKVEVVPPTDPEIKDLIDRLARYISKDGQVYV
jgi:hypothetical protein